VSAPGGPLVKPDASRTITVELTSPIGQYEGVLKKVIGIETNDPQIPLASLTIKAFIYAPLQIEPRFADVRGVTAGTAARQEFLIRNRSQQPITITQIAVNPTRLATTAPRGDKAVVLKPGQALKLVVTFSATLPVGPNSGRITLYTDWEKLPEKAIPVCAYVVPAKR